MIPNDPGGFDERLSLLPPVPIADDLGGERPGDGTPLVVWARFERALAAEAVDARRPADTRTVELTIRRRSGNFTGWTALWRGTRYRVAARIEREAREYLGLRLEEGAGV